MSHTRNEIELANVKLNGLKDALFQNTDKFITASNVLAKYADGLDYVGTKLQTLGGILTVGGLAGVLTIGRSVLSETEEYGNAISKVGGYLDITGSELEHMSELALQFGKDTRYSAVEAADAISELAKGGMTQAQIEGGALDATLQLASAGNLSLAQAAETAVQAINVFGLDAADASQVADALAGAANRSTAEVNTLAESFRYVSGWAGLADYPIQDVSGALGLLADRGLQAEVAGTGLRNVMQRIGAPTDKAKKLLEEYGFEAYNAEGKMKPLVELVDELNEAFGDLEDQERNEVLNAIFGARGLPAAVALMESGSAVLEDYIDATKRVGYAEVMAQAQMGDLGWALEYLRGEFETFQVNLGSAFTPMLISAAEAAEGLLAAFNNLSKEAQTAWARGLVDLALIGPKLLIVGTALRGIAGVTRGLSTASRFTGFLLKAAKDNGGGAVLTFKNLGKAIEDTSGGATEAATAISLLKSGLIVLATAAAAYVAVSLWQEFDRAKTRGEKLNRIIEQGNEYFRTGIVRLGSLKTSFEEAGGSASDTAKDVYELIDDLDQFYKKVAEGEREVETNASRLNTAAQIIEELGGQADLSEEDMARLAGAIHYVNDELGTSYELHADNGGVIYDETGKVANLEDAIWRLIDAKKEEIRLNAYGEQLEEAYKNEADAADALAAATERRVAAEEEYNRQVRIRGNDKNVDKTRLNDAIAEEEAAQAAYDLSVQNLLAAEGKYNEAAEAQMRAAEASRNALRENIDTVEGLEEALDKVGMNVNDFVGFTIDDFNDMQQQCGDNVGLMIAYLNNWNKTKAKDKEAEARVNGKSLTEAAKALKNWNSTPMYGKSAKAVADTSSVDLGLKALNAWNNASFKNKFASASVGIKGFGNAAGGIRPHADGGIAVAAARYHAGGSIVNVPNTGYPLDLVGEAGAEAIVPLTNRRYSQPFVDLIADGVSRRMGGGTSYNLYINGARVNDDPQIRGQFIDLMQSLARKGAMNVGHN